MKRDQKTVRQLELELEYFRRMVRTTTSRGERWARYNRAVGRLEAELLARQSQARHNPGTGILGERPNGHD